MMDFSDFPAFKNLTPTHIHNFTSACDEREYSEGTVVITKGQHGNLVYFVIKGRLQVFLPNHNGNGDQMLAELAPGAVFGEMEFLTEMPRSASVCALTDVKVLAISFDALRRRIDDGDGATLKIMFNIAKILAYRLAEMDSKLSEIEKGKTAVQTEELREFKRKLFSEWNF